MINKSIKIGSLALLLVGSAIANGMASDKVCLNRLVAGKTKVPQNRVEANPFTCSLQTIVHVVYNNGTTEDFVFNATSDTCAEAGRKLDVNVAVFGIGGYVCGCYRAYEL